jgi:hypothetical protein
MALGLAKDRPKTDNGGSVVYDRCVSGFLPLKVSQTEQQLLGADIIQVSIQKI